MIEKYIQIWLFISIVALNGACRTYSITGKIICPNLKPLADVKCQLYGTNRQRSRILFTDSTGLFHFQKLYRCKKYKLEFFYPGSITGISAYDMVLQTQANLVFHRQLMYRDSSFQLWHLISADINQDSKIDDSDNVALKEWIDLPSNRQFPPWLFLPVEKAFATMPFHPEMPVTDNVFVFNHPHEACIYLNLVGIKIGDLNSTSCYWP